MKKLVSIVFLFVFFLLSCAPNVSPKVTVLPESTVTSTFTPAPTSTPTITSTPTNTPDPNMPAGAIGKDDNGYYKDVQENGNTVRYYWVDYNHGIRGWFTSHILEGNLLNGGIPLIDGNADGQNLPPLIPFYFYVEEGLGEPFIRHPQNDSTLWGADLSSMFTNYLRLNYLGKVTEPWSVTSDERTQFSSDFSNGKISFPFTTPSGNFVWRPSQKTGYKFYAVKWEDADPALRPEYYYTSGGYGSSSRWTIFSDSEGNLIVFDAQPDQSTNTQQTTLDADQQLISWISSPLFQMLYTKQLPAQIKYWSSPVAFWNPVTSGCQKGFIGGTPINSCETQHFEIVRDPNLASPTPTITLTPAPTVALESIFPNIQITETDTFNDPNGPGWKLDSSIAKISNGDLEINGMNWKGGISRVSEFTEGEGIVTDFKFTQNAYFTIGFNSGTWATDSYRQYGIYLVNMLLDIMKWKGSNYPEVSLSGNLTPEAGKWYSLLMTIGKNGNFYTRVWDPSNPQSFLESTLNLGSSWSGLSWTFSVGGGYGM